jgi:putative ABC transport system permease protein
VRRLPGVVTASGTSSLPVGGGGFYLGRVFLTTGQPEPPASSDTPAQWSVIQPAYLRTMGVPVGAGREFDDRDTAESTPVILINESMARRMFPNESPLGKRIRSWRDENVYREIVGVVGDLRFFGLSGDPVNTVYVPHAQDAWSMQLLVVRTSADPREMPRPGRNAIWEHDPKLAISDVKTMREIVDADLARPRFSAFLLGVFAATALLMGAIGIYGLVSYVVAQQTKEIGIRMALGALRGDILRTVTGRALALACAGVAAGVVAALGLTRLMETMLFGVSATDAEAFLGASALLIVTAAAASYIPARRASRADPLTALRYA